MIKQSCSAKPLIELLVATLFWGFGFTATVWCLDFLDSTSIIVYRFAIASAVGALFIFKIPWMELKREAKLAIWAAVFLTLTLILQTEGLKSTTATKSAFITTLYVVIVPLISHLLRYERVSPWHLLFVVGALLGTAMIVELRLEKWALGDTYTFLNAVAAALHIVYVGRISHRSKHSFALNVFQSFWIMLMCLPLMMSQADRWHLSTLSTRGWVGLLSLGFGSSLLAFYFQFKAQKKLSTSLSSLLFLLESPFSFLFAMYFLGEKLSAVQVGGAGLILASCVGATLLEGRRGSTEVAKA